SIPFYNTNKIAKDLQKEIESNLNNVFLSKKLDLKSNFSLSELIVLIRKFKKLNDDLENTKACNPKKIKKKADKVLPQKIQLSDTLAADCKELNLNKTNHTDLNAVLNSLLQAMDNTDEESTPPESEKDLKLLVKMNTEALEKCINKVFVFSQAM